MTQVIGVHGTQMVETYLVSLWLPNQVTVTEVRVTKGILSDADVLIGMDIINRGDFAVSNFDGVTKFSFRVPSRAHIDFVEDHKKRALAEERVSGFAHGGTKRKSNRQRPNQGKGRK